MGGFSFAYRDYRRSKHSPKLKVFALETDPFLPIVVSFSHGQASNWLLEVSLVGYMLIMGGDVWCFQELKKRNRIDE